MKFIVRAVKERLSNVELLKEQIPNLIVSLDTNKDRTNPAFDNFLQALYMVGDDSCVHLEDDIILTSNFYSKIIAKIMKDSNSVHQFFSMRSADLVKGSRVEAGATFMSSLCFYLPKGMSKELYQYGIDYKHTTERDMKGCPYDLMVSDFLKEKGLRYYLHVPNLVDHIVGKSVIDPRRSSKRVSKTFIK